MDQENYPPVDVLVIWVSVLREDHAVEAEKQKGILASPRVEQYFDEDGSVARWFKTNIVDHDPVLRGQDLFAMGITWDAFFFYTQTAEWDKDARTPAAAGGPIVRKGDILSRGLERLKMERR